MENISPDEIIRYQPVGFLEQLGERLKTPVGLGEFTTKRIAKGRVACEAPVMARDQILGTYSLSGGQVGIDIITYHGMHPVANTDIELGYASISPPYAFGRNDRWTKIQFPGIVDIWALKGLELKV